MSAPPRPNASPGWATATGSVKGPHKPLNRDRMQIVHDPAAGLLLLAVADGHGTARDGQGDVGSRLALEAFADCARSFAERSQKQPHALVRSEAYRHFPQELVHAWRRSVQAHDGISLRHGDGTPPADGFEAFGSTLLGVLITGSQVVAWQLGDGDLLFVTADGTVQDPLAEPEQIGDETDSLASGDAWRAMRTYWAPVVDERSLPALVTLSTDGLSKSFAERGGFVHFVSDFHRLAVSAPDTTRSALPGWLAAAGRHSGDDVSFIAAWWDAGTSPTEEAGALRERRPW